ncbi:hypothetical protein D9Q98_008003 [Chlorella vulgaris]|uniref:tRNA-5-taurinomethyluridine 2-sulfurtransferase n=1 Tax=Chlorella vulgaris TaxID=3077 RepID=A0A9D4TI18_CHLVU|nr:hypothetical protein D9Q98_008003 [Chlorella vulgaris]
MATAARSLLPIRHFSVPLPGTATFSTLHTAAAAAAAAAAGEAGQQAPLWSGNGSRGAGGSAACKRVAVGISGGVDSAVAALLLQRQGHEVVGVFMRNWDEGEEQGNENCSVEQDLRAAAAVCRQLDIPLHEADFVSAYWTQVFAEFIAQCSRGLTPNPDLACNRHIKFGALLAFAERLGAHTVATGHYAQLAPGSGSGEVQLLRGADRGKDQTYFLASVQQAALRRVLFPIGHLQKPEVRRLAAEAGLAPADRRSSAGICFIGRRDFGDFLSQYISPQPGRYVDVDSGTVLGPCPDVAAVTHGQRPGIGGAPERVYAVGKDVVQGIVYVAHGGQHPALLCTAALLRTPHWLSWEHAARLAARGWLRCEYRARYGQQPKPCTLHALDTQAAAELASRAAEAADATAALPAELAAGPAAADASCAAGAAAAPDAAGAAEAAGEAAARLGFQASAYCRLRPEDSVALPSYLVVQFDSPATAITPQQAFVLYDQERCLGTALIAQPGRSLHETAANKAAGAEAVAAGGNGL